MSDECQPATVGGPQDEPPESGRGESETDVAPRLEGAPRCRLLIADDLLINLSLTAKLLRRLPVDIEIARDGEEALERFKLQPIDLVLMDMGMPVMDGLEATRQMRAWEAALGRAPTPIIALTASTLAAEQAECLRAGCNGFLAKPVTRDALVRALSHFLQRPDLDPVPSPLSDPPPKVTVDPEIAELIPAFLAAMRERAEAIIRAAHEGRADEVKSLAHQIIGPGGSYGFPEVSDWGRGMEQSAQRGNLEETVKTAGELRKYLSTVEIVYA